MICCSLFWLFSDKCTDCTASGDDGCLSLVRASHSLCCERTRNQRHDAGLFVVLLFIAQFFYLQKQIQCLLLPNQWQVQGETNSCDWCVCCFRFVCCHRNLSHSQGRARQGVESVCFCLFSLSDLLNSRI